MIDNHPDDIRNFDNDPRSPFYDSSGEDAVNNLKSKIGDLAFTDIQCNAGINIDLVIKNEINYDFDYFEFLIELSYDLKGKENCIELNILKKDYPHKIITLIVDKLLEHLHDDVVEYLDDYDE